MTAQEWLNFGIAVAALVLHTPRLAAALKAAVAAVAGKQPKGM